MEFIMSYILYVVENEVRRDIWRLGHMRAYLFLGITKVAASTLKKKSCGIYDDGTPSWRVEPQEFCELVEEVFAHPSELLYPWAQVSAGIYESIKGESFSWQWSRNSLPFELFRPVRYEDYSPSSFSGKRIGSFE
jgi:hypothetical protein